MLNFHINNILFYAFFVARKSFGVYNKT